MNNERTRTMSATFHAYLRDRENNKIMMLMITKYTNDIEQAKIDIMLEESDEDYECILVRFKRINHFSI